MTGSQKHRARHHLPYAFTEFGVAMLSSVLRSERAIQVNIAIMRTFGRLRGLLASHAQLARKLEALEEKYDAQFKVVFDAIRALMAPPTEEQKKGADRIPSQRRGPVTVFRGVRIRGGS